MELPKNVAEIAKKVKDGVVAKAQEIDVIAALKQAMRVPGAKINRETFLRKELSRRYPKVIVERAIEHNPAYAGVERDQIDKLAKHAIDYETSKATAISFGTGLPGGVIGVAVMPADIVQYFVFMLRVIQQLAYLYGFDEFELDENHLEDDFDNEALNEILVFMGVMFGAESAGLLIKALAKQTGKAVAKKLARQALMKGAIYPVIKKIAPWLGMQMNKQIFANGVGRTIPVVGGVIAGGLTFATFKPCANRLKAKLMELPVSDPEFYKSGEYLKQEEPVIPDAEDVVFYSIDPDDEAEETEGNVNDSQITPPLRVHILTKAA